MKENLHFKQLQLKKTNKQNKKNKQHVRLVISSIREVVAVKTDDEVYILGTIKIYSYFSSVFPTVPKKVKLLKISKVLQLLTTTQKIVEKKIIIFLASPYAPCFFFRKEDIKFLKEALLAD